MWMRMVEVNMQFITGPGNGYEVGADDIPQSNIPLVTLVPFCPFFFVIAQTPPKDQLLIERSISRQISSGLM